MTTTEVKKYIGYVRFHIYQDILDKTNEEIGDYNLSSIIKDIAKAYIASNAKIYNITLIEFIDNCSYKLQYGMTELENYPITYYNYYDEDLKKNIVKFNVIEY
jgi:hypothetical protein